MKKLLIFFACLFLLVSFRHPYHVGSVEFNYSEKSKTFQITARFFMDDLENALNKKYNTSLHFQNTNNQKDMNVLLQKYSTEYLKLKINNKFLNVKYLGYEEDKEAVVAYLESESVSSPKKVEVAVSMLYNFFDDQLNIIHIIVNGVRKSQKLSFPDRYLYQAF